VGVGGEEIVGWWEVLMAGVKFLHSEDAEMKARYVRPVSCFVGLKCIAIFLSHQLSTSQSSVTLLLRALVFCMVPRCARPTLRRL